MKKMVLFAIGPDRPGLVSEVSSVIHDAGGNVEDSRMATLAGDFALIFLFSLDPSQRAILEAGCKGLEKKLGITTQIRDASDRAAQAQGAVHSFTATGHDQPGIVRRLTEVLAKNGANVVSMETSLVNLAFHGTPMFKVTGKLSILAGVNIVTLRDRLEDVCEDLELLLDFEPY